MITPENMVLVIVDVQGKLAHLMCGKEALFRNLRGLIQGIQILRIPILWMEQNPKGLGPTVPEIAELLSDTEPISKMSFSCCGNDIFIQQLDSLHRKQVLIAGIETHVCVYQTAMDLLERGYDVEVVADAVSSRTVENKRIGLEKIRQLGARWTSTEMALFELLRVAEGDAFKAILKIVK